MDLQPFQKIAMTLDRRILRGTYASGSALPSRLKLMREFGVARATLDRAIQELIQRGRVVSRHGSGTYVLPQDTGRYRVAVIGWYVGEDCPSAFSVEQFGRDVLPRSEWRKLLQYDGILWIAPESGHIEIMESLSGQVAQVAVNRTVDCVPFVSIDYRWAYREITLERLARCPDCRLVFLRSPHPSLAVEYRLAGFLDACRSLEKYYEILELPDDFGGKCSLLEERLRLGGSRPLVLVSDSLSHTGAVMRWASWHGGAFSWGRDLFYSDFDDDYPRNVWGVEVTSFLQDIASMSLRGAETLLTMLREGRKDGAGELIAPQRREGDT